MFSSLAVVVEDSSSSCCVTVKVMPHMTVSSLKQQVRCLEPINEQLKDTVNIVLQEG